MAEVKVKKTRKKIKGLKTQERIIESAIHCLAHLGHATTTFQSIADHCGISQPLVVHYFKKRENVFPHVIDYLIRRTQNAIHIEVERTDSATLQLKKFIRLSLLAVRSDANSAKVFLTLNFLAAFEDRFRDSSSQIKQMVSNELIEILVEGIKTKEFNVKEVPLTARMLTAYITGIRMTMLNEKSMFTDETFIQSFEDHCLKIVGANPG